MKAVEFCYWLQGYFEIHGGERPALRPEQVATIQNHLALVFKHEIDPSYGLDPVEAQAIHDGDKQFGGVGPNGEIYRC